MGNYRSLILIKIGIGIIYHVNPNITWEIIQNNPDKDWNGGWYISCNPNITWDIIQNNPDKDWDW